MQHYFLPFSRLFGWRSRRKLIKMIDCGCDFSIKHMMIHASSRHSSFLQQSWPKVFFETLVFRCESKWQHETPNMCWNRHQLPSCFSFHEDWAFKISQHQQEPSMTWPLSRHCFSTKQTWPKCACFSHLSKILSALWTCLHLWLLWS